jgi:CARDB
LGTVQHTGTLNVGDSYTESAAVNIPNNIVSGVYYITPWTDSYSVVLQNELATNVNPDDSHELYNDNYKARQVNLIGVDNPILLPDLSVSGVTAPVAAPAGGAYTVSWNVANLGVDTGNSTWQDYVWLSDQPNLYAANANKWLIGSYSETAGLADGQSETISQTYRLAPNLSGSYLFVVANGGSDGLGANALLETTFANNVGETPSAVSNNPSDLQVTNVSVPATNYSGDPTTLSYTVTNKGGDVWNGTKYWTDKIYFSSSPVLNPAKAILLDSIIHSNSSDLLSGQSYTNSDTVILPRGIGGDYFLYVVTDPSEEQTNSGTNQGSLTYYSDSVFEGAANANNTGRADLPVIYREPDLKITDLSLPGNAPSSGETISVSWTVTNSGTRQTHETVWNDAVFLSRDPSLDPNDLLLGTFQHQGQLDPGQSYTASQQVTLPESIGGPFYIIVYTDSSFDKSPDVQNNITPYPGPGIVGVGPGAVPEFQGEGNNATAKALTINLRTPPDLMVTQVLAPQHATVGQPLNFSYTVTNSGGDTPPLQSNWSDSLYLSRDQNLDTTSDRYLGSFDHTGGACLRPELCRHRQRQFANGSRGVFLSYCSRKSVEHYGEERRIRVERVQQLDGDDRARLARLAASCRSRRGQRR